MVKSPLDNPPNIDARNWLKISGYALIVSGVFHVLVMWWLGGQWEGPVSWRKPILFGISTGMTMVSLGWLVGLIRPMRFDRWCAPLISIALVVEVFLITLQQWRGEASHFNTTTWLNAFVDHSITWLISAAAVFIFMLTWRCFGAMGGSKDIKLAARSAMVFLSVSCLIGFAILFYGQMQLSLQKSPELIGQRGVLKFPHGVAIHAIQFLPALCWIMSKLEIAVDRRYSVIGWTSGSIAVFLGFSVLQTVEGRARFDLTMTSSALLLIAIGLLLPLLKETLAAVMRANPLTDQKQH